MENGGKDCFDVCKKQGRCDWCGMDGLCCRKDRIGNGCDGTFGGHDHQCVLKPGNVLSNKNVLICTGCLIWKRMKVNGSDG